MISNGIPHDIKIAPNLISKLDLEKIKMIGADKGYGSESLCEQITKTAVKANIPKKMNSQSNNHHMD